MDMTWLTNSPTMMFAGALAALAILLLLAIVINLVRCRTAVLRCHQELDQQTSLLKSQDEYLEGLDFWMQHFSDHLIKRMKIPPAGAKSIRVEEIEDEEEKAPVNE